MKYYFDNLSKGFYIDDNSCLIPSTAKEIKETDYQSFINPPTGKYFDATDGIPKLLDIPIQTISNPAPSLQDQITALQAQISAINTKLGI